MKAIYTPQNTKPAYQLNWGLTLFWRDRAVSDMDWLSDLQAATEEDGVRFLKHRFVTDDSSQLFVSTKPHVQPSQLIRSVKGRLQYLIRAQVPKAFRRNYCVRSVGSATRTVVEDYLANQLGHHCMADPQVQQRLETFQKSYPQVNLAEPSHSSHGQYWYNLHVVLVHDQRWMEVREDVLSDISTTIERAASKHGYRLSRVALLPDHIHLTIGCSIDQAPEQVALGYLNNCAYAWGMKPVYQFSYYVGTIGEYDLGAIG